MDNQKEALKVATLLEAMLVDDRLHHSDALNDLVVDNKAVIVTALRVYAHQGTPAVIPERGHYYVSDVDEMAKLRGMSPDKYEVEPQSFRIGFKAALDYEWDRLLKQMRGKAEEVQDIKTFAEWAQAHPDDWNLEPRSDETWSDEDTASGERGWDGAVEEYAPRLHKAAQRADHWAGVAATLCNQCSELNKSNSYLRDKLRLYENDNARTHRSIVIDWPKETAAFEAFLDLLGWDKSRTADNVCYQSDATRRAMRAWHQRAVIAEQCAYERSKKAVAEALAAHKEATMATITEAIDHIGALGVMGGGYCFCGVKRDPLKEDHEPECRDLVHSLQSLATLKDALS